MIRRVQKSEKEKISSYLRGEIPATIRMISDIRKYGFESDDFYIYADFWSDGEIKFIFTAASGKINVYSYADEIDTIDIYVFLRDNFIGYRSVQGIEEKIRDFQRHTLFRDIHQIEILCASARTYNPPAVNGVEIASVNAGDLRTLLTLSESAGVYNSIDENKIKTAAENGEMFVVKENGVLQAAAFTLNKALRHAEIMLLSEKNCKTEYRKAAADALCTYLFGKKYKCSVRAEKNTDKILFKNLGFAEWGKDLYIAR